MLQLTGSKRSYFRAADCFQGDDITQSRWVPPRIVSLSHTPQLHDHRVHKCVHVCMYMRLWPFKLYLQSITRKWLVWMIFPPKKLIIGFRLRLELGLGLQQRPGLSWNLGRSRRAATVGLDTVQIWLLLLCHQSFSFTFIYFLAFTLNSCLESQNVHSVVEVGVHLSRLFVATASKVEYNFIKVRFPAGVTLDGSHYWTYIPTTAPELQSK